MKRIMSMMTLLIIIFAFAVTATAEESKASRLIDEADLLTKAEEAKILERLDEISEKYEYDVVIVTQESIGDENEMDFADDYYDYNGYGFGKDHTGLLLLITFDEYGGIWWISTCGEAISAVTGNNIQSIGDEMSYALDNKDYFGAFDIFIEQCDYYIDGHINGFPFETGKNLVIALVIGFVIAFICVSVMKGKLKTVAFQKDAANYVKQGSMNVTVARDFFLYSTISRVAKSKDNGSGTHTSSSGRRHGGGGGRF